MDPDLSADLLGAEDVPMSASSAGWRLFHRGQGWSPGILAGGIAHQFGSEGMFDDCQRIGLGPLLVGCDPVHDRRVDRRGVFSPDRPPRRRKPRAAGRSRGVGGVRGPRHIFNLAAVDRLTDVAAVFPIRRIAQAFCWPAAPPALAHGGADRSQPPGWTLDPWVMVPLGLLPLVFIAGQMRLPADRSLSGRSLGSSSPAGPC